jgi:streptogramin lyase
MQERTSLLARTVIAVALTTLQSVAQSTYTPYTFTTLAGLPGSGDYTDGTGSAARFNGPRGMAVDSTGNIYVGDTGNDTIRKVTPAGVVTTLAGAPGNYGGADGTGSDAQFFSPRGVAVDRAGIVYVADTYNNTIRKVSPAGVVTTLAGKPASQGSTDGTGSEARFTYPSGVAVDSAGNVYVADTSNNTIRKVTPAGVVTTLAGHAGIQGSEDGTGSAARFLQPTDVAVDSAGNVYVADFYSDAIRKVTPAGVVTTLAGQAGIQGSADGTGRDAQFRDPWGVAVDGTGNVYVTDYGNSTIRKVTPEGVVTTLAGGNNSSADGTGSGAGFNGPEGVAVDSTGNLYVADTGNYTIRRGYPEGVPPAVILISGAGFDSKGQFGFTLMGPAGQSAVVEASTNLVSWLPIWTNILAGAVNFSDLQSGVHSSRFYRAHSQ